MLSSRALTFPYSEASFYLIAFISSSLGGRSSFFLCMGTPLR